MNGARRCRWMVCYMFAMPFLLAASHPCRRHNAKSDSIPPVNTSQRGGAARTQVDRRRGYQSVQTDIRGLGTVGRSLTATAPFHRRAEDLDWQAALLPRVRLVSGWCRARRPLNKEVWQGREERRQGRLCGSRSDLIGRQRGRSSRRYQFGAGAGS